MKRRPLWWNCFICLISTITNHNWLDINLLVPNSISSNFGVEFLAFNYSFIVIAIFKITYYDICNVDIVTLRQNRSTCLICLIQSNTHDSTACKVSQLPATFSQSLKLRRAEWSKASHGGRAKWSLMWSWDAETYKDIALSSLWRSGLRAPAAGKPTCTCTWVKLVTSNALLDLTCSVQLWVIPSSAAFGLHTVALLGGRRLS